MLLKLLVGWGDLSYLYVPENYENDSYFDLSFLLPEGRFGGQSLGDIDSLMSSCMKKVWLSVHIKMWFYRIEWDRIEKFTGKAARCTLLWECWLCLSPQLFCCLVSSTKDEFDLTHAGLYCCHWQCFVLKRLKSYQETSLIWKWKNSEACATLLLVFFQTEF